MSLVRQMAAVGQSATAAYEEEVIKNLRTARFFRGKIQPVNPLELTDAPTKDLREQSILHTRDRVAAYEILPNDRLEVAGTTYTVLGDTRVDNPASLHIEFNLAKWIEGVDQ